jgi:hypothetical protein
MKYVVNTQIANIVTMQQQTEMITKGINQQIEMLLNEVL